MNLKEFLFLNEAEVIPGLNVTFEKMETPKGTIMTFKVPTGQKFGIAASLENFNRFEKWDGKEARADVLPLRKKLKLENGVIPLAKIRTDVKIEKPEEPEEKLDVDKKGETVF